MLSPRLLTTKWSNGRGARSTATLFVPRRASTQMPDVRTLVTEVTTGLAIAGSASSLGRALASPPSSMVNVTARHYDLLRQAYGDPNFRREFDTAWENGSIFLRSDEGLRGRIPVRVEWRGPAQNPGYDIIPADLRVDHVYLLSCKYQSKVVNNGSPGNLFDLCLTERRRNNAHSEWYLQVAEKNYQAFYEKVVDWVAGQGERTEFPARVQDLDRTTRELLKDSLPRGTSWPVGLRDTYLCFSHAVAKASAARWQRNLGSSKQCEMMLWRLLRLGAAPYFILGASDDGPVRLRILTPWDWRQEFYLKSFDPQPDLEAGQPVVRWTAIVGRVAGGDDIPVRGHVEVRWSHGRFCGACEAKVYIDTPFNEVPGYVPITA